MEEAKDWAATCSQLREENARLQEYCQKLHVENLELHKALREGAFEKYAPMIASYVSDGKLVEENARLLAENRELRIFATDIVNKRWDFFYPIEKAVETASFDFFKHVNSKFQALNKEPTL
jgi:predicted ATPase